MPLEPIFTAQLNLLSHRNRAWESQETQEAWAAGSLWEGITKTSLQPHSHPSLWAPGDVDRAGMNVPISWLWKLTW